MGLSDLAVGEAKALGLAKIAGSKGLLLPHNFLNLPQEPPINLGQRKHLLHIPALGEGLAEEEDALGIRDGELGRERLVIDDDIGTVADEAEAFDFQAAQGLLQALLERATDGHGLADGFHLRRERFVRAREFFKGEARQLGDDVVDGGLEARRGFAGDVVLQFVERVTDGELGSDLRDGEAGGLRRERGAAADARVHLDDDHAARVGMHGELDVRTARLHADLADAGEGEVAHDLVLAIRERLDRGHGDAVAGVYAHGVEVLDGADDDAVVCLITHDLHFELFPA